MTRRDRDKCEPTPARFPSSPVDCAHLVEISEGGTNWSISEDRLLGAIRHVGVGSGSMKQRLRCEPTRDRPPSSPLDSAPLIGVSEGGTTWSNSDNRLMGVMGAGSAGSG